MGGELGSICLRLDHPVCDLPLGLSTLGQVAGHQPHANQVLESGADPARIRMMPPQWIPATVEGRPC